MEEIKRDVGDLGENTGNEILKVWNAIPESYFTQKIVALGYFVNSFFDLFMQIILFWNEFKQNWSKKPS